MAKKLCSWNKYLQIYQNGQGSPSPLGWRKFLVSLLAYGLPVVGHEVKPARTLFKTSVEINH